MDLAGANALVTGGGHGIGRAIVEGLAEREASHVTVVDLDQAAAKEVAEGVDGLGIQADASDLEEMSEVVSSATEFGGALDVVFSNVGIWIDGGIELDIDQWDRMWRVNVMSHLVVAKLVLPSMIERGRGHISFTASAAGLLSSIGSAPYAVTKSGTVAFAEWLAIEHSGTGVAFSCVCPLAVDTPMLADLGDSSRRAVTTGAEVLGPSDVAESAFQAVEREMFLALPHEEVQTFWQRKSSDHERWLRGMKRLRADAESAS